MTQYRTLRGLVGAFFIVATTSFLSAMEEREHCQGERRSTLKESRPRRRAQVRRVGSRVDSDQYRQEASLPPSIGSREPESLERYYDEVRDQDNRNGVQRENANYLTMALVFAACLVITSYQVVYGALY